MPGIAVINSLEELDKNYINENQIKVLVINNAEADVLDISDTTIRQLIFNPNQESKLTKIVLPAIGDDFFYINGLSKTDPVLDEKGACGYITFNNCKLAFYYNSYYNTQNYAPFGSNDCSSFTFNNCDLVFGRNYMYPSLQYKIGQVNYENCNITMCDGSDFIPTGNSGTFCTNCVISFSASDRPYLTGNTYFENCTIYCNSSNAGYVTNNSQSYTGNIQYCTLFNCYPYYNKKELEVEDNRVKFNIYIKKNSVPNLVLANNSCKVIQQVAREGTGANYWNVGDKIPIKLNGTISKTTFNNETYYAFIIGFNHNPEYEGEHSIHFQMAMDADGKQISFFEKLTSPPVAGTLMFFTGLATNVGGWETSDMKQTLMPQFLNLLPDEWQNVIAEIKKYTDNVGGGTGNIKDNVTTTNDKIFLLSEIEVSSTCKYANTYEGDYQTQYAYYANGKSKVFYTHSENKAENWWLRSPSTSNKRDFAIVSSSGNITVPAQTQYACGIAPAFAVA